MKNLLAVLLLVFVVACETQDESTAISLQVHYPGEYYIFMDNTVNEETHIYVKWGQGDTKISEEKLVSILGELTELNIVTHKVTGEDYPDLGELNVKLKMGDSVIMEGSAPEGDKSVEINYSF